MPDQPNTGHDTAATRLTDNAWRLVESIMRETAGPDSGGPGINRWLLGVTGRQAGLVEELAGGLAADDLKDSLLRKLEKGHEGRPLAINELADRALALARRRGLVRAAERDVVAAILVQAGFFLVDGTVEPTTPAAGGDRPAGTAATAGSSATPEAGPVSKAGGAPETSAATAPRRPYRARATRSTPTLDKLGWDLTRAAAEGKLNPVIGRAEEIQLVIETLCRRSKRNPALVGPAGVGKTAIVEGLAQLIVAGEVPPVLEGARLISLPVSSLVADSGVVGKLEERMQDVIHEASQDGVILFIDEMHMMKGGGAGSANPGGDVANQLKPALARGDVACIAATTDDEYRSFIERDSALERRFQPVRVNELSPAETLAILRAVRDDLERERGVRVTDAALVWLVDFADRFLKNRFFPDKGVDCLEQCMAHGVTRGLTEVDLDEAEAVARRMVGMPVSPGERLAGMSQILRESALLTDGDVEALEARLGITMRGFDFNQERPNAVVLLTTQAEGRAGAVAETVAASLYGSPDRVIDIDFGRFTHHSDVTMLVGAPPGYIGYDDSLPLHRLAQMPWCVLLCRNVHAAHPQVRDVLTQGLEQGYLTTSRGRRVHLSDALVMLTAPAEDDEERRPALGFTADWPEVEGSAGDAGADPERALAPRRGSGDTPSVRRQLERALGQRLLAQVDLVFSAVPDSVAARRRWLEHQLVAGLGERCRRLGLEVEFDPSLVDWLLASFEATTSAREWERLVDERVSPLLIPYLDDPTRAPQGLRLTAVDGRVEVIEAGTGAA